MIEKLKKYLARLTAIRELNASDAYLLTKYGEVVSSSTILHRYLTDINADIDYKCVRKSYSLTIDITEDIDQYLDDIIQYYQSKEYNVLVIDNKCLPQLKGQYLLIEWKSAIEAA